MTEEEKEAIEQIKSWREYIIKNKDKVNKANDLEFCLRLILNLIQKQQLKLEKKDKIIDEMTLQLVGLTIWDNKKEDIVILKTEEQVKQYFEKKVEENNGKNI